MKKIQIIILLGFLVFASCSARINGTLQEGGSANLTIQAALEPRMTALIRSLRGVMGTAGSDLVLDGPSISRCMAGSHVVVSVSIANTGPAALEGGAVISQVEDFLSLNRGRRFISYSESQRGGRPSGRVLIYLDKETAPELMALLSREAVDYLTALMAPAVLGEDLSENEYLSLLGSLYGRPIADEIRAARITASIEFPGPITAIQGGTAAGNRADFVIPLLDLLVLEKPLSWEIAW